MNTEMKKFETILNKLAELMTETVEYADREGVVKSRNARGQFLQKLLGGIHYNLEAAIDWLESDPKNHWNLSELRAAAARTFQNQNGSEIAKRQQEQALARVAEQLELVTFGHALRAIARDVYVEKTGTEPFPYRPLARRTVNQDVGETDLMKQAKALGIKIGNVGTDYNSTKGDAA